ncbi:MAG TPA: metallophosphoesterase [Actinomycetota bacterium]|nr:metallophosphoesterase [Actinomycetota bacterium]
MSGGDVFWKKTFKMVVFVTVVTSITLLGLVFIPAARAELGPATVSARVHLGSGNTILRLPPLGALEASTHTAPLNATLSVEAVDIDRLATLATTAAGRAQLQQEIEDDLQGLVLAVAVRYGLGAALLGTLLGLVVFHRRWDRVLAVAVTALAAVAVPGVLLARGYEPTAFDSPRYTGSLQRARAVMETLTAHIEVLDEARDRYALATRKLSDLFVLLSHPEIGPTTAGTTVLHVSDIHANPLGLELTQELSREFDVAVVIDTGDISSAELDTGRISTVIDPVDAALAREVGRVGVPYVFTPGNHDSPQLRARLERTDDVHVLNGQSFEIAGISILGWADPTFSTTPVPEDEKAERRVAEAPEVGTAVEANDPDILAVHDVRLAEESFGDVPLVLAGHTHERDLRQIDGTTVLTVGSTGATGLKSFTVEAERRYEAEVLYFEGAQLIAVDYVSLADFGTDFRVDRRILTRRETDEDDRSGR